jgi:hypothetical protein
VSARKSSGSAPGVPVEPQAVARPVGRSLTPEENRVLDFRLALERYVDLALPGSQDAFTLAHNAIRWLVMRDAEGLQVARRCGAWLSGFSDPDSDAAVIVAIEHHVRVALGIRHGGGDWGDPAAVPAQLRDALAQRFPQSETLPTAVDLGDWLDRHVPATRRGKLTTAGIVARIVHRGRLLGARGDSVQKTLERVTKALSQKRHPRW